MLPLLQAAFQPFRPFTVPFVGLTSVLGQAGAVPCTSSGPGTSVLLEALAARRSVPALGKQLRTEASPIAATTAVVRPQPKVIPPARRALQASVLALPPGAAVVVTTRAVPTTVMVPAQAVPAFGHGARLAARPATPGAPARAEDWVLSVHSLLLTLGRGATATSTTRSTGTVGSTGLASVGVSLAYRARAAPVIGAAVPPGPAGSEIEVPRAAAPTATPVASAADAVPISPRASIAVPATPSVLRKEVPRRPASMIVGRPLATLPAATALRRRPKGTMATITATEPGSTRAHTAARAARAVQGAQKVTLVAPSAVAAAQRRRAPRASPAGSGAIQATPVAGSSVRRTRVPPAAPAATTGVPPFPPTIDYSFDF